MPEDIATPAPQPPETERKVEVFEGAVMALLHPSFDLYGIDAKNEAMDQVDDITTLAQRHLIGMRDV